MVLLNKIKDFALFAGFTREQYSQASELFPESNRKLLMALSFLLGTVVLALALAAIFWESRGVMVSSLAYIAFSVLNYGMFFISYKFGVSFPKVILPFCYVVLISCYILAIMPDVPMGLGDWLWPWRLWWLSFRFSFTICPFE